LIAGEIVDAKRLFSVADTRRWSWTAAARVTYGPSAIMCIFAVELKRLGWHERDLASRRKSDPDKLALGILLRQQTTLAIKWIAARLHLGTSKGANANRHRWRLSYRESPGFSAPPAERFRVRKAIKQ